MNFKSRKIWIIAAIIFCIGIGIWYTQRNKKLKVNYREVEVTQSHIDVNILSTGVVQPENRLEIKPPIAGRVEQVLVKEGQVVKKGSIMAWMSSTERAALLDAARSKGMAELKHWEELYNPTPVLAPINGTVIQRNVESGQTFTNADAVFVMSDRLTIKAQVDETDIAQIKLQQKAKIVLDAYPNEMISAHVDQIAYDAKTVNNVTTYTVDVLPEKTPDFMRSGMTANVTFFVASKQDVLVVGSEALKVREGKYFVLLKDPSKGKPLEKEVSIGLTDGKFTEITEGLNQGDTVMIAEIKSGSKNQSNPFMPMGGNRRGGK